MHSNFEVMWGNILEFLEVSCFIIVFFGLKDVIMLAHSDSKIEIPFLIKICSFLDPSVFMLLRLLLRARKNCICFLGGDWIMNDLSLDQT